MQGTASEFHLRRKYFRFLGAEMRVFDHSDKLVVFAEAKRLKLKEDITLYGDEQKTQPVVNVKARQALDIGATYDVRDAGSGQALGSLRRQGLSSLFVRDAWTILDEHGQEIGSIREDSVWKALVRRFVDLFSLLVPQHYHVTVHGQRVGEFRRSINLFVIKYDVSFDTGYLQETDWRLALSYPVVLSLIEDSKQ